MAEKAEGRTPPPLGDQGSLRGSTSLFEARGASDMDVVLEKTRKGVVSERGRVHADLDLLSEISHFESESVADVSAAKAAGRK